MDVDVWMAMFLLAGTVMQAVLNVVELRDSKRHVLAEWNAEDELLQELRWWRRRGPRKVLEGMRSREVDRDIARLRMALGGWVALVCGAGLALVSAVSG